MDEESADLLVAVGLGTAAVNGAMFVIGAMYFPDGPLRWYTLQAFGWVAVIGAILAAIGSMEGDI